MTQNNRIPIYAPVLGEQEIALLGECVRDSWLSGGKKVKEFESRIAKLCEAQRAVACNNGTVALYLGLLALGIGPGDKVIVPDFTFVASANAVKWTGAEPVFVDIDKSTLNLSITELESVGLVVPGVKAIMPVHIYGRAANMDAIMDIAHIADAAVIEDACQGIGVMDNGRPVGAIGDVGCFSFYADKTITTGEGGMVVTNQSNIADRCTVLSNQGRMGRGWYVHDEIGFNFRMTDLQAAVGLAQLDKLDQIVKWKKRNEELYRILLHGVPNILQLEPDHEGISVPFRHNVFLETGDMDSLAAFLLERGIEAKRVFFPLHRQPCYRYLGYIDEAFPNSVWAYEHGLSLPSSPLLSAEDIERVCEAVKEFIKS